VTVANLKPLIFSVSGFALSKVGNIFVFRMPDVACILMSCNGNMRNLEFQLHIMNRVFLGKYQGRGEPCCAGGTSKSHYRPNSSFMEGQFNVGLQLYNFKREFHLTNILTTLDSIRYMCKLRVILRMPSSRIYRHVALVSTDVSQNVSSPASGRNESAN
jgi:hypothetical protein